MAIDEGEDAGAGFDWAADERLDPPELGAFEGFLRDESERLAQVDVSAKACGEGRVVGEDSVGEHGGSVYHEGGRTEAGRGGVGARERCRWQLRTANCRVGAIPRVRHPDHIRAA